MAEVETHLPRISINAKGRQTNVLIDGQEWSRHLSGLTLQLTAADLPRLTLELPVGAVVVSADAQVERVYRCQVATTFGVDLPSDIQGEGPTPQAAVRNALEALLATEATPT